MSTHNLCFEQKYEKYQNFYLKIFIFLVVKFSIYLDRRVFVMHLQYQSETHSLTDQPNQREQSKRLDFCKI